MHDRIRINIKYPLKTIKIHNETKKSRTDTAIEIPLAIYALIQAQRELELSAAK